MQDKAGQYIISENENLFDYLKTARIFSCFPDETLKALVPLSKMMVVQKGETILHEGVENHHLYFLVRGEVDVFSGNEFILKLRRMGDIFGEMSIINNRPSSATVVATGEYNKIFAISSKHIGDYSDMNPEEFQNFLFRLFSKVMSDKLYLTTEKAKQFERTNRELLETKEKLQADIKKREKVEKELIQAKHQAELASHAKTRFLSNMSHELRTPLNSVLGFSQIILKKIKNFSLPGEFREYFENIKNAGQSLNEIINNILDLTKIESGKVEVVEGVTYLPALLKEVFEYHQALAIEKGIVFKDDFSPNLPGYILTDKTRLKQIITNLLGNAIKFTPNGKMVRLRSFVKNDVLKIEVMNEGIGIPKEDQERIFSPFEQVDDSATRSYEGTGLGLAITHHLVNLLHGTIHLESEENIATTFTVSLPVAQSEAPLCHKIVEGVEVSQFSSDLRVLVVEDNRLNQKVMGALLEELGVQYFFAENGAVGVQKTKEIKPDLIFMDMHMPVMGGLDAIGEIRKDRSLDTIPIIALSAEAFIDQQKIAYEAGVQYYLTKPINLEKVIRVLGKFLNPESALGSDPNIDVMSPLLCETVDKAFSFNNDLLDHSALTRIDVAIIHDIILTFKQQAESVLNKIRYHVKQRDLDAILKDVHLLKGSGLTLGTTQLVKVCKSILDNGRKDCQLEDLLEDLDNLPNIFLKTCEALSLWEEDE